VGVGVAGLELQRRFEGLDRLLQAVRLQVDPPLQHPVLRPLRIQPNGNAQLVTGLLELAGLERLHGLVIAQLSIDPVQAGPGFGPGLEALPGRTVAAAKERPPNNQEDHDQDRSG
jgi:hypothetical protein